MNSEAHKIVKKHIEAAKKNKKITISKILGKSEDYYTKEYAEELQKDFELLEKILKDRSEEEVEQLHQIAFYAGTEFLRMLEYLTENRD